MDGDTAVDRDPSSCSPISMTTNHEDLVLRADLGVDADFASVELVVDTSDDLYTGIFNISTNIGDLYDGWFSGLFEFCHYVGVKKSGHVTNAKMYYYCACLRSSCRYVFLRVVKGDYVMQLCEMHVYPNKNYSFTN